MGWGEVGLGARSAQQLMRIAADPNIARHARANANHDSYLPQDRQVLVELCGLEEKRFDSLLADGTIHGEMRRGDLKRAQAAAAHGEATPLRDALAPGRYRAILADPPWAFETWGKRRNGCFGRPHADGPKFLEALEILR